MYGYMYFLNIVILLSHARLKHNVSKSTEEYQKIIFLDVLIIQISTVQFELIRFMNACF